MAKKSIGRDLLEGMKEAHAHSQGKRRLKETLRESQPSFPHLSAITFDPDFKVAKKFPVKVGEVCLFLGDIPNIPGHCAVALDSGKVLWLMHPGDFRLATEEET